MFTGNVSGEFHTEYLTPIFHMISKLKQLMKQHPAFMDAVAVIYNLFHRNNAWKYRNVISCKGAFLNNVKFHIIGHNNKIIIGRKA